MDVDPSASMGQWDIEVTLGGWTYLVPAMPAVDWWPVLAEDGMSALLGLLVLVASEGEQGTPIEDRIIDGEVAPAALAEALTAAIEEAAGRTLTAALLLAETARLSWPAIGGQMALRGFRWDVQPLGAALDAIYSIVVPALPEKAEDGKGPGPREQFLKLLDGETVAGGKPSGKAIARAEADFVAAAGPRPTSVARASVARSGGARTKTRPRSRRLPPPGR